MIFAETIERISAILQHLGFKFHFTGGAVAAFYGDPRFTQDLDLVIQITAFQPETKNAFEPPFSGVFHSRAGDHGSDCRKRDLSGDR